jgi:hypothetical protein
VDALVRLYLAACELPEWFRIACLLMIVLWAQWMRGM